VERLVFDFANLAEAPDEAHLAFARVWGTLGLCPHGQTIHHQSPPCLPRSVGREYVESLSQWRRRARHVLALLNIRAALNREEAGATDEWQQVWPGKPPVDRLQAAQFLGVVTSSFLSTADAQPMVECSNGRLSITFIGGNFIRLQKAIVADQSVGPWLASAGNLFAELAMRTTLAIQEGPGWSICSEPSCRHLYRPKRVPARGRRNFCPDCGKPASWRWSKRSKAEIERRSKLRPKES
jgi:hypothetical protein